MGVSGQAQYMVPLVAVMLLYKFIVLDLKKDKYKKFIYLGLIIYSIIKVLILRYFNYNQDLIDLTIQMMVLLCIFIWLEFNILNKNKESNLHEVAPKIKLAHTVGILLILIPFFIKLFKLYRLYGY